MDGIHDLGGLEGFGPVEREPDEPVFHAPWEARTFGLVIAVLGRGAFTTDEFRYAIERMPPGRYLQASYYERWLDALARLAAEKGLLDPAALARRARRGGPATRRRDDPEFAAALREAVRSGAPTRRPDAGPAAFAPGDRVRVRRLHPRGHTRCPRYVRGLVGTVERCHGTFVLADASARGDTRRAEPLYTVGFQAAEVWGESAEPAERLYADLWESYLERP